MGRKKKKNHSSILVLLVFIIIIGLAIFGYKKITSPQKRRKNSGHC